jgi:hypothetical protein
VQINPLPLAVFKTNAKLWQAIRAAFAMIMFQTMEQLFGFIAKQHKIQLE